MSSEFTDSFLRKFAKSGMKYLTNIATALLANYGVYPFFVLVGEPGTGIGSRLYVFPECSETHYSH